MTPIAQALKSGYSEEDLINFMSKIFPALMPKIKQARTSGYSVKDILGFLSKTMGSSQSASTEGLTPNQIIAQKRKEQGEKTKSIAKGAAKLAVGYGASKLLPVALGKVKEAIRPLATGGTPGGPQPMGGAPVKPSPIQQAAFPSPDFQPQAGAPPPAPPTPRQAAVAALQQGAPMAPGQSKAILESLGVDQILNKVDKKGKNLEQIAQEVMNAITPEQKKFLQDRFQIGEAKPLVGLIKDWFQERNQPTVNLQQSQNTESLQQNIETPKPQLEKGSLVTTPSGITGEIKDIKEKSALIDDNGKLSKVNVDEIEPPSENMIQSVQKLLNIPEIDRSSVISYWAFNPEDKQLFIQFHNGESYVYRDVDEDTINTVAEALGVPKTQGENIFGAWSPDDTKSVGATMIQQIIGNPKYKKPKKGEPANPLYLKLRKGYDYWSPLRTKPKRK